MSSSAWQKDGMLDGGGREGDGDEDDEFTFADDAVSGGRGDVGDGGGDGLC